MSVVETAKTLGELAKKGMHVDLQEKIIQLREEALELQEENLQLRNENRELREKVALQETVHFKRRVYWRDGDETPYCPYCWEKSKTLIHLSGPSKASSRPDLFVCQECRITYWTRGEEFGVWGRGS